VASAPGSARALGGQRHIAAVRGDLTVPQQEHHHVSVAHRHDLPGAVWIAWS
jgi:hypothetical protein